MADINAPDMNQEEFEEKFNRAIQKVAFDMEAHAKRIVPVDTGRLRSSIRTKVSKNAITISSSVNYAQFVEFGTINMDSQPFIRPAMHRAINVFIEKRFREEFGS